MYRLTLIVPNGLHLHSTQSTVIEDVVRVKIVDGALWIDFDDDSETILAQGRWHEVDIEQMEAK